MNDFVVVALALWLCGLMFVVLIKALPNHRNSATAYLAATSWVSSVVFAVICGVVVVSGVLVVKFFKIADRHRNTINGAIFLALCAAAIYFGRYLLFVLGAP